MLKYSRENSREDGREDSREDSRKDRREDVWVSESEMGMMGEMEDSLLNPLIVSMLATDHPSVD